MSAHVAVELSVVASITYEQGNACASVRRVRTTSSHLLVERDARSKIGLRHTMPNRELCRMTESFLAVDGRSDLHSRRHADLRKIVIISQIQDSYTAGPYPEL